MKIELLGRKLGHSLSPELHSCFADYSYTLRELEPNQLDDYFNRSDFDGLNVTIPYKKDVIKYCDLISENAEKIGSVNTIYRLKDGRLFGDNTDYEGFSAMVKHLGIDLKRKKVLVLGSGGASLTAVTVCKDLMADSVIVISRNGQNNYNNIYNLHCDADLIVNCTPVGMYPNIGERLVNLELFKNLKGVLDMVYNPYRTALMQDAERLNIPHCDGLIMLTVQGIKSGEMFTGKNFPEDTSRRVLSLLRYNAVNITLIGMPGCGKSTVAREISKIEQRPLKDIDSLIVEDQKKDIPQIFKDKGQEYFRDIESKICFEVCREKGQIIATGGGAILKQKNREVIRANSVVVFIKSDLSSLDRTGRPLSTDISALENMYEKRLPLYRETADIEVELQDTPQHTAAEILRRVKEFLK